jgi:hypothetical protein
MKKIYENYGIDEFGKVYGMNGKALKPATDLKGYLRVGLTIKGKLCTKKVHRLVAEAFIPNPNNKPCVNHRNGVKNDNNVDNLEWCTYKENTQHAIDNYLFYFNSSKESINKTIKRGSLNGMALLDEKMVLEIRNKFKKRVYTRKMLSIEYGVTECCIKDVILKRTWKHV